MDLLQLLNWPLRLLLRLGQWLYYATRPYRGDEPPREADPSWSHTKR